MESFEVLANIKNWNSYDIKGYSLNKAEAEACIKALEKATPKNPRRGEKLFRQPIWECPECGAVYVDKKANWHDFCPFCGQAIRWNNTD